MRITGLLNHLVVSAVIVSTVVGSSPAIAAGPLAPPSQAAPQTIQDVSLAPGGLFRGQLVATNGQAIAGTPVVLQQQNRPLAETVTNERGEFAFQGVPGGIYLVSAAGEASTYRLWAPNTAPPVAQPAAMLVQQGDIVRAQVGGSGLILSTLVVGGLTWGIIEIMDGGHE